MFTFDVSTESGSILLYEESKQCTATGLTDKLCVI